MKNKNQKKKSQQKKGRKSHGLIVLLWTIKDESKQKS